MQGGLTDNALVADFEVRLEVLGTRLYDGVHRGDEQRAVAAATTDRVHVGADVGPTAERLGVHAADTSLCRPHSTVPRLLHGDHVVSSTDDVTSARRTTQLQRFRRTSLNCTQTNRRN